MPILFSKATLFLTLVLMALGAESQIPTSVTNTTLTKKPCEVYRVTAFVEQNKTDFSLVVFPGSKSETKINVDKESTLKVLSYAKRYGTFRVKLTKPLKMFGDNSGQVLSAELAMPKPHLANQGTEIICEQ